MPRGPRLDAPGVLHHVMVRGDEQREIFRHDDDRADFMRRLARLLPETQTTCFAWCLLSNHLHLVLRSGPKGLAPIMRRLLTGYAVSFNRRHDRVGHLFQNRYHSLVCEEEPYLLALVRYVHLNPLRAGIVSGLRALESYPWCGHGALLGRKQQPWQATEEVLSHFDAQSEQARRAYHAFVAAGVDSGADPGPSGPEIRVAALSRSRPRRSDPLPGTITNGVLGSPEFAETLRSSGGRTQALSDADCRTVVLAVCRVLGISPEAVASGRRTRPLSNGRAVVAFVARTKKYRISSSELATALGTSPQAVLLAERRGAQLLKRRVDLKNSLKELLT